MTVNARAFVRLAVVGGFLVFPATRVRADGGTVRMRQQAGDCQVTVFTSPTPLRAGPVDISVLLQDSEGNCLPDAPVTVRLTARETAERLEYPATADAATNKLLRAAVFQLPDPGWWDVEVTVEGPHGPELLRFAI